MPDQRAGGVATSNVRIERVQEGDVLHDKVVPGGLGRVLAVEQTDDGTFLEVLAVDLDRSSIEQGSFFVPAGEIVTIEARAR